MILRGERLSGHVTNKLLSFNLSIEDMLEMLCHSFSIEKFIVDYRMKGN